MDGADRISNLPDEVLFHILSFLPTNFFIATSMLAKRWRPLWRSVPSVDFDDQSYTNDDYQHLCFVWFIYTVMLSRDVQSIKRFRLHCTSFWESSTINTWINYATQRNIEHLEISLPFSERSNLHILSCRTLVVLKLNGLTIDAFSSVQLPSLKILHLHFVEFQDYDCLKQLLYGCPILEDLRNRFLLISKSFPMGKFQTLSKLVKVDIHRLQRTWDLIRNVELLHLHKMDIDFCFEEQWEEPKLVPECL